jgi:EmrB/QacA subfamily drug resistance transporter
MLDHGSHSSRSKKWGVLLTTQIGAFTVILNNTLMNVAMPFFMSHFKISAVEAQWVVTIFALGMALTMPLTGFLGNRIGQNKIFIFALLLFLAASLLGAFSGTMAHIILFRFLQGISGGLVLTLSVILIFKHFEKKERGLIMGFWGVSNMIASAIGPTFGGIILSLSEWNVLFLVNVPLGFIALVFALFFLKNKEKLVKVPFDKWGFILVYISIVTLIYGVEQIHHQAKPYITLLLFVIGGVSLYLFVKHELRTTNPLLNLRIFRNKIYTISLLLVCCSTVSFFSVVILIPLWIQEVMQESPLTTGLVLFSPAIAMGIAMIAGGRVLDRKGPFIVLLSGVLMLIIFTLVLITLIGKVSLLLIALLLFLYGIGTGLLNAPSVTTALNSLRSSNINDGSAVINTCRQFMKLLSVVIISIIFEWRRGVYVTSMPIDEAGILAVRQSFGVILVILILILPVILYVRKQLNQSSS